MAGEDDPAEYQVSEDFAAQGEAEMRVSVQPHSKIVVKTTIGHLPTGGLFLLGDRLGIKIMCPDTDGVHRSIGVMIDSGGTLVASNEITPVEPGESFIIRREE